MKPIKFKEATTVIAEDQPPYLPLPAHIVDEPESRVITCWGMTWWERLWVLCTGRVWLSQMSFRQPLQPQLVVATSPFKKS